ncbi:hypothetical protein QLX08_009366 [Tetragonisca angustula]|uniref:Uncharacterized protein n=1 Tax=Tetragonisca angustula TaxID=166442 RepID=A0AAW0ZGH9_9HYME
MLLPPQGSYRLQPMNVSFMALLNTYYEVRKWLISKSERNVTIYEVTMMYKPVFFKAATIETSVLVFRATFNLDVFLDCQYTETNRNYQNKATISKSSFHRSHMIIIMIFTELESFSLSSKDAETVPPTPKDVDTLLILQDIDYESTFTFSSQTIKSIPQAG